MASASTSQGPVDAVDAEEGDEARRAELRAKGAAFLEAAVKGDAAVQQLQQKR
jgi:hypothetical protein